MELISPPYAAEPNELAHTLLDVAPTGTMLLYPVYAIDSESIVDIAFEYLNPVAQRKMLLPARPTESLLTLYPADEPLFAFYRQAYYAAPAVS